MNKAIRCAATWFDNLPVSPASAGRKLIGAHAEARRVRASRHPEWAAIEARRDTSPPGHSTFLSEDLTWDDWARQDQIADALTPEPRWLTLAHRLAHLEARRVLADAAAFVQRARRGWADDDVWDLGPTLCQRAGAQLVHLSVHAHGWPSNEEFPAFTDWTAALRTHGEALLRFAADTEDADVQAAAQDALRWVADHVGHLWD